jgi:hypothetical protein
MHSMYRTFSLGSAVVPSVLLSVLLVSCGPQDAGTDDAADAESARASAAASASAQDAWWQTLTDLCGQAFAGELAYGGGDDFAGRPVMHVRVCEEDELQIPFHVGENRSRTWILTRTDSGIRLKHDHRHEDGSEDEVTQYGGDTRGAGSASVQEFHADDFTAALLPEAATNVWTMEVVPGERFTYMLRRADEPERFRVDFDLTTPVEPPPAPWGY